MIDKINKMRRLLEDSIEKYGLEDNVVLEISQNLDKLIFEYHIVEGNIKKSDINDDEDSNSGIKVG